MPRVCRILILLLAFSVACDRSAVAGSVRSAPTQRTLIQNAALVITMEPGLGEGPLGLIERADVLIVGDTLAAIGLGLSAAGAQRLDASGKIVLPGFVDVHNHLWQSVIRGCGSDKDLSGWLEECVFPTLGLAESDRPQRPTEKRDPCIRRGQAPESGWKACRCFTRRSGPSGRKGCGADQGSAAEAQGRNLGPTQ